MRTHCKTRGHILLRLASCLTSQTARDGVSVIMAHTHTHTHTHTNTHTHAGTHTINQQSLVMAPNTHIIHTCSTVSRHMGHEIEVCENAPSCGTAGVLLLRLKPECVNRHTYAYIITHKHTTPKMSHLSLVFTSSTSSSDSTRCPYKVS